jgi:hypothetical protein
MNRGGQLSVYPGDATSLGVYVNGIKYDIALWEDDDVPLDLSTLAMFEDASFDVYHEESLWTQ